MMWLGSDYLVGSQLLHVISGNCTFRCKPILAVLLSRITCMLVCALSSIYFNKMFFQLNATHIANMCCKHKLLVSANIMLNMHSV